MADTKSELSYSKYSGTNLGGGQLCLPASSPLQMFFCATQIWLLQRHWKNNQQDLGAGLGFLHAVILRVLLRHIPSSPQSPDDAFVDVARLLVSGEERRKVRWVVRIFQVFPPPPYLVSDNNKYTAGHEDPLSPRRTTGGQTEKTFSASDPENGGHSSFTYPPPSPMCREMHGPRCRSSAPQLESMTVNVPPL